MYFFFFSPLLFQNFIIYNNLYIINENMVINSHKKNEMLKDALRALVYKLFHTTFYVKKYN